MIVIIENIPKNTKRHDLFDFIQPALKGYVFQKSGRLGYVKVVVYRDSLTEKVKYYGLALIPSDIVAERVIKRLNKRKLLERRVLVRKYYLRSWRNDPRVNHSGASDKLKDMRKGDRRLSDLKEFKRAGVKFTGQKNFSRSSV